MFQKIREFGDEIVDIIDPADSLALVLSFKSVVVTWFALYVMFVGFSFVWGKTHTPIRDITEKFIMFSVIGAFAFNIGLWYGYAVSIINELSAWASQGNVGGIYALLEIGTWKLTSLTQIYIKNDTFFMYHFEALFGSILIHTAYYAFGLVASILLLFNTISLKILVFTFPLAVVSLFFPLTKDIFSKWVQLLIINVLSLLFITIFFQAIYNLVMKEIQLVIDRGSTILITTSAFEIASLLIVGIFLFKMALSIAESLTSASIERAVGTAARGTAIGVAGTGYAGVKGATAAASGGIAAVIGTKKTRAANAAAGKGKLGGALGAAQSIKKGVSSAHSIMKNRGASASSTRNGTGGGSKNKSAAQKQHAKFGAINKYKKAKDGE